MWRGNCQADQISKDLKQKLLSEPVLRRSNWSQLFFVFIDMSQTAVDATITQLNIEGSDYAVAYISRKLIESKEKHMEMDFKLLGISSARKGSVVVWKEVRVKSVSV